MAGIGNYLEATFEQGKVLKATYPEGSPLHNGICTSLVWTWMKEYMDKPGGTAAARIAKCRSEFLKAGARQAMYSSMHSDVSNLKGRAKDSAVEGVAHKFLGLTSGGFHTQGQNFDCLKSICTKSNYDKTFQEIGFYFKEGGGHSTGLHLGPNATYYFDPNIGEFKFPWDKWKVFFNSLAAAYKSGKLTVNSVTAQQISKGTSLIGKWEAMIAAAGS